MKNSIGQIIFLSVLPMLACLAETAAASTTGYSFGEVCTRPPIEYDVLPELEKEEKRYVRHYLGVGLGESASCVFVARDYKPHPTNERLKLIDNSHVYFYEARPTGWQVTEQPYIYDLEGFVVFEPGDPIPLLWTKGNEGGWFRGFRLQRWNPEKKTLEAAQPKDLVALKRYVGLAVVMSILRFPAGIHGERSPYVGGKDLPYPYTLLGHFHAKIEDRKSLSDLLGEPLLGDINKPFEEFAPRTASDAALALALNKINRQLKEYDDAIFGRRKVGPILGALYGSSLDVFNGTGVQNAVAIASELTRRYPQIPEGWFLLAKMAEWAMHLGMGENWLGRDHPDGLMPDPAKAGIAALEKYLELRGWTEQQVFPKRARHSTLYDDSWLYRRVTELLERLRTQQIDREALGKSFTAPYPTLTDDLARTSPELQAYRP